MVNERYPGAVWEKRDASYVGFDKKKLKAVSNFMQGRGCIVRNGYMIYSWGDESKRGDVASAAKPVYSHFLFQALQEGRITSLDEKAVRYKPSLEALNKKLAYKDREITLRHMANQISCYGVAEKPGTAYCYNDWQMALFWEILFLGIYSTCYENVDHDVLHPLLTNPIQCEDNPTFMAFGIHDRPGRLAISPRDFARIGLLYLHQGKWKEKQLLKKEYAFMAVTSPLSLEIPRAGMSAVEMLPGQRTIGSNEIPDNQNTHEGSYSWLWWINGVNSRGQRFWQNAPEGTFAACGHKNAKRGLMVVPELDLVMSWNDTVMDEMPEEPRPLDTAIKLLLEAQL